MIRKNIATTTFFVAFIAHLLVIYAYPHNFAYDAYQRWGGRDHILVQSWLPLTQLLIWATAKLGGGLILTRILLSAVASLAVALATRLARHLGGEAAALTVMVGATFGPFTSWTSTLYLEGTFLCVLFGGLLLAAEKRWFWADVVIGLIGLVRYEGWPFVLVYIAYRQNPKALLSLWGVGLWLGLKALGLKGYHASPVDFDDWEGLSMRFVLGQWLDDMGALFGLALNSSCLTWLIGAGVGLVLSWRTEHRRLMLALGVMLGGQLIATCFWVAGLESAINRMLVIPGMLATVMAGVGVSSVYPRLPAWRNKLVVAVALVMVLLGLDWSIGRVQHERFEVLPELNLLGKMEECSDCVWWVVPRQGLGTRDRHDGCEIIQGLSEMYEGQQFYCAPWLSEGEGAIQESCTGEAIWMEGGYRVKRKE